MLSPMEGRRCWEEFEALVMQDKFPMLDMMHNRWKPEKHWEFHESMSAGKHEPGTTGPWWPYVAMGGPKSAGKRVGYVSQAQGGRRFRELRGYSNYHALMACVSLHEGENDSEATVNMANLLTGLISFNHDIYYMDKPTVVDAGEKILDLLPERHVAPLQDQDSPAYDTRLAGKELAGLASCLCHCEQSNDWVRVLDN